MEHILIIGATGQIGSELTMELRKRYGNANVVAGYIPGAEPKGELKESGPSAIADVTDGEAIADVYKRQLVPCRDLHTDACLIFRHYRIIEACHIDAFLLHTCSVNLGQLRVIQHNGTDSALCRFDIKSGSRHLIAEVVYILNKFIM